jgi:hypothetical protein
MPFSDGTNFKAHPAEATSLEVSDRAPSHRLLADVHAGDEVSAGPVLRESSRSATLLDCFTVFLSAFLLFSVQPLMARLILPEFGGSASVWAACVLFFQTFLLLGYAYADWTSRRLSARAQGWTHATLLVGSLSLLPLRLHPSLAESAAPALRIALILAVSAGVPYFLLSATSPLIQMWHGRRKGSSPYRLYALSNLASLLALVSYPAGIEPFVTGRWQLWGWSAGFAVFVAICSVAAMRASRYSRPVKFVESDGVGLGIGQRLLWVMLAAIPSALLLAATNHLCQNVAAIPFLWVVPLVAYLLSLILCFDYDNPRRHRLFLWVTAPVLIGMGYVSLHGEFGFGLRVLVPLITAGLFITCMAFHGELVARKPDPSHSSQFYLMVSLGGVIGGALVVWAAPLLLRGVYELPLLLVAASMSLLFLYYGKKWYIDAVWAATSVAVLVFAVTQIRAFSARAVVAERNFYGALRVIDSTTSDGSRIRAMVHGTVSHGTQFQDTRRAAQATTYYALGTGVELVLDNLRRGPQSVAIVGLGTGALAVYAKPGDQFVFYELNPQVIDLARSKFSYLSQSRPEIVGGDGRLALARERRQFDMIFIDAFSGDAIPTHLLTQEAVQIYLQHLKENGILGFHISNSSLDLESPVAKLGEASGLAGILLHTQPDPKIDRSEAIWVVMSRNASRLRHVNLDLVARPLSSRLGQRVWTDDYSNLFQLLKGI